MKRIIVSRCIISSICLLFFSCETDEPPKINQDIAGVWVLEELYSNTYQNETEVIHSANIEVYGEQIEFLPEGIYLVGLDLNPAFNAQLAFAFASNLVNEFIDSTEFKVYGTWESNINVFGDRIMHFDRWIDGLDSYMIVDELDENNLTLAMVVNHQYPDINIDNFQYPATYQGARHADFYTYDYVNDGFAYDDGFSIGENIGYYQGYNATYTGEDIYIFSLFYGQSYADTFVANYDFNLADANFDNGYLDGYEDGYTRGENEAMQHNNGKEKSVTLTYKFARK